MRRLLNRLLGRPTKPRGLYHHPRTFTAGFECVLVPHGMPSMGDAPRHEDVWCPINAAVFVDENGKSWVLQFWKAGA